MTCVLICCVVSLSLFQLNCCLSLLVLKRLAVVGSGLHVLASSIADSCYLRTVDSLISRTNMRFLPRQSQNSTAPESINSERYQVDPYILISILLETLGYGSFLVLFFLSTILLFRRRRVLLRTRTQSVALRSLTLYLVMGILMFFAITAVSRLLSARLRILLKTFRGRNGVFGGQRSCRYPLPMGWALGYKCLGSIFMHTVWRAFVYGSLFC